MKSKIRLQNSDLVYEIRRRRGAKRLSLSVNCDANVILTAPHFVPNFLLEKFIQDKADWLIEKIAWFKEKNKNKVKIGGSHQEFATIKKEAYYLVKQKLEKFNTEYNFCYKKIYIRNQKTRWGSCSSRGTISFNYRVARLPEHLTDYVVVHELCHLGQMNHSPKFWQLVGKTIPDWAKRRRELKKIIL